MTHDATAGSDAAGLTQVAGFPLALDRFYHPGTHLWVRRTGGAPADGATVRIGMDALGIETSGTLASLSFQAAGSALTEGRPFGQLEAAKFVGPLLSPVSGVLLAVNDAATADPGIAERDPYGGGWLIDVILTGGPAALPGLLTDPGEIAAWFAGKVAEYRLKGVLAE